MHTMLTAGVARGLVPTTLTRRPRRSRRLTDEQFYARLTGLALSGCIVLAIAGVVAARTGSASGAELSEQEAVLTVSFLIASFECLLLSGVLYARALNGSWRRGVSAFMLTLVTALAVTIAMPIGLWQLF
jgi:hypothetical protein